MRIVSEVWQRLRSLLFRSQEEREMDEELRFHIDKETEKNVAEGMSAGEARRQAHVRLGGVERVKERTRQAGGVRSLQTLLMDFKIAGRGLLRTPVQTVAAIIALALGVGITTAMFSIIYAVYYRALPFEDAERFVVVWQTDIRDDELPVSLHDFVEWREAQRSFADLAAHYTGTLGLRGSEEAIQLAATFITWDGLQILGAEPVLGRNFVEEDDQLGAPLAAIVSHRVWEERLGGDAGIVGQEAVINGEPATIIGVMPDGFHFPESQDVWVPLRLDADQVERGQGPLLTVFGHLRDGVTRDMANAEMGALAQRIATDHPDTNEGIGASVRPYLDYPLEIYVIHFSMMGASLLVLLIACLNIANLLLARAAVRTREIALRSAMGAGRLQIMTLMLAESSILAVVGALVGTGIAWLGVRGIRYSMTDVGLPYWMEFKLDLPALAFTVGAAALAGIVAGMIPAVKATTGNLTDFLKDGSRGATGLKIGRLSRSLVAVEVAFSACLLVAAGLMTKTVANLTSFDYPFAEQGILTARIGLFDSAGSGDESERQLFDEVLGRLVEVPGVQTGALASGLPGIFAPSRVFGIEGRSYPSGEDYPVSRFMAVSAGFFDLLGVEPVRGRVFSLLDRAGEQPVAIVNQSFARRYFADEDPVGRQRRMGRSDSTSPWRLIVGVVPDLLMQGMQTNLETSDGSGFYLPMAQGDNQTVTLLVRSQGAPLELTDGVRDLVRSVDPDLAIFRVNTLYAEIYAQQWGIRILGNIYVIFGAAALFLASVGLFGVVSFGAERRTQEVGVRMAVGARAKDVVQLIVGQGLKQVSLGLVFGILMAAGLARLMVNVLFQTEPLDPVVYLAIVGLILAVGVLASLVPAIRASRLDPVQALRSE